MSLISRINPMWYPDIWELRIRRRLQLLGLRRVRQTVIELNSVAELSKLFGWTARPTLDDPEIHQFDSVRDVNERRLRDAEVLATVVANVQPAAALDIGTSTGHSAAMIAINAPNGTVYTINIPPEAADKGEGGNFITHSLDRQVIGSYYRERGLRNIVQIYADTAKWDPRTVPPLDLALIDGCHDTNYVVNDTRKALSRLRRGGFVLWHDFSPDHAERYDWIHAVCLGVERLLRSGLVRGEIYHVRDSWFGVYRAP